MAFNRTDTDNGNLIQALIKRKFSCARRTLPRSIFLFRMPRKLLIIIFNDARARARANSQRATTRTNLIGSFTFSRDISIRICIPRGKSVGLSPRSAERHEKCAASFPPPPWLCLSLLFFCLFALSPLLSLFPCFISLFPPQDVLFSSK